MRRTSPIVRMHRLVGRLPSLSSPESTAPLRCSTQGHADCQSPIDPILVLLGKPLGVLQQCLPMLSVPVVGAVKFIDLEFRTLDKSKLIPLHHGGNHRRVLSSAGRKVCRNGGPFGNDASFPGTRPGNVGPLRRRIMNRPAR